MISDGETEPLILDKPFGWSPVETIRAWQAQCPAWRAHRLGYAGRLDPLAEGVMLVLVDGGNRQAQRFLDLEKEYEIDCVLGLETDTLDRLGVVTQVDLKAHTSPRAWCGSVARACEGLEGSRLQKYPLFSSVRVQGKPLFWWGRQGLEPPHWPARIRTVRTAELLAVGSWSCDDLRASVATAIQVVRGDFRQELVGASWRAALDALSDRRFPWLRLRVVASSGTYMRALCQELANAVGSCGLTVRIQRTRVGTWGLERAEKLTAQTSE